MKLKLFAAVVFASAIAAGVAARLALADGMVQPPAPVQAVPPPQAAPKAAAPAPAPSAAVEGQAPTLTAVPLNQEENARKRMAVIRVRVAGVQMVDPSSAEGAQPGEGHLRYQVDEQPFKDSTSTRLSIRDLSSGKHRITVMLVGNDNAPLGPSETITVSIP